MSSSRLHEHDTLPQPRPQEIADGVFTYVQPDGTWWINNCGFVTGPGGVIAVDSCSTEARTRQYLEGIRAVTTSPVRVLVNTHSHGDHTNGNYLFDRAAIVGHRYCREEIVATAPIMIPPPDGIWEPVEWGGIRPEPPFLTFENRLDLYAGDLKIELHYVGGPAHTRSDVLVWIPERGVLFTGDLVFKGAAPFVLMGSVAWMTEALKVVASFEATTLVPGHGEVCGPEVIDQVADYLRFVQRLAEEGHRAGLTPLETAREADLGAFTDLSDSERIVGNLHRAYAELEGAAPGAPIDLMAAFSDMIEFNGGRPMRCLA